ncbi:efflux RND transporter periplasmic adaptor subunit [Rubrivivax gelatinosus]|uniref:efflux RND transporter periplasmic adaptor subunit n=1 Tax=Rubrivivax gelatinosus TaxID=28068 RepID=UPI0019048B67|nr:efflux RND transporter periplasmic adaptor subunit [Rubrivivax gelatinosus]
MSLRSAPRLPRTAASITLIGAACAVLSACGDPPGAPGGGVAGTPEVGVIVAAPQVLPLVTELPGRIASTEVAEVRPQVTGIILARSFTEGSVVKAGQLLYQIDPATYRASVDSAKAALDKVQANLVVARLKSHRLQELAAMKAASQQDADDAAASLLQAEADVASAKATLEQQRINLDYTRVLAPIAGRIGRSTVTQGALVTANQTTALSTVQRLDPVYVDVTQDSSQMLSLSQAIAAGRLKPGSTKARLLLENGATYALEGRLKVSEVTVDQATGAVTLRAEFPNPKGLLLPGMFVRAVVEEGVLPDALLVPQPAVTRDESGRPVIHVVGADNKLERRHVQADRAIGGQWLITSGLKAGERVVVEGQDKARPASVVDPKPLGAAPGAAAAASSPASAN